MMFVASRILAASRRYRSAFNRAAESSCGEPWFITTRDHTNLLLIGICRPNWLYTCGAVPLRRVEHQTMFGRHRSPASTAQRRIHCRSAASAISVRVTATLPFPLRYARAAARWRSQIAVSFSFASILNASCSAKVCRVIPASSHKRPIYPDV